jgi:DNA adenine methylase
MTILDCLGFIRHYLHLFHRHRNAFLDEYQKLLLNEPESAVNFALKQAFLALRQAAIVPQTE